MDFLELEQHASAPPTPNDAGGKSSAGPEVSGSVESTAADPTTVTRTKVQHCGTQTAGAQESPSDAKEWQQVAKESARSLEQQLLHNEVTFAKLCLTWLACVNKLLVHQTLRKELQRTHHLLTQAKARAALLRLRLRQLQVRGRWGHCRVLQQSPHFPLAFCARQERPLREAAVVRIQAVVRGFLARRRARQAHEVKRGHVDPSVGSYIHLACCAAVRHSVGVAYSGTARICRRCAYSRGQPVT